MSVLWRRGSATPRLDGTANPAPELPMFGFAAAEDLISTHATALRLGVFVGVLVAMVLWEALAARLVLPVGRARRWPGNLGIVLLDAAVVRLVFPFGAVGVAMLAEAGGWGVLPALGLPGWARFLLAMLLLDLVIYLQHVLFHAVPALWRLHRMHHADIGFDATTGLRFHPVEILLSLAIKLAAVAALGASAGSVVVFEVVLNATAMFNHANIALPLRLDRALRWLVVTPDMHRVHHSVHADETNSNFGFNLPWWDRLLGTYRPQPRDGHADMVIGLPWLRDPAELRLDRMLLQPLRNPPPGSDAP